MNKAFFILLGVLFSLGACTAHRTKVTGDSVYLYLEAPRAKVVQLATSLDGYEPRLASKAEDGTWVAVVTTDGEFRYFFVVDGKAFTPPCRLREKDDFGSETCIFAPDL